MEGERDLCDWEIEIETLTQRNRLFDHTYRSFDWLSAFIEGFAVEQNIVHRLSVVK